MDKLLIEDIIRFSKGSVRHQGRDNMELSNISTDSRTIRETDLFLPLCGDKFDGHDYIDTVIDKGIQAVITSQSHWNQGKLRDTIAKHPLTWIIGVQDTLYAYQNIAKEYLQTQQAFKIIISGSNGKTTTKEMIRSILSQKYTVAANEGNFNNQIGVPKTIFTIDHSHDVALIEMGTGKPGDIARLAQLVEPDIAVITSIGLAHTEFLGSIESVAEEKSQIFSNFKPHSIAVLNRDDPYFPFLSSRSGNNISSFSLREESHVQILDNHGLTGYTLSVMGEKCRFRLGGEHNVINLHFAILVARAMDMPVASIIKGIESIAPVKMRSETSLGRFTLIKDCYNANPSSVRAGLDYVSSLSTHGKKITVLGDMLELGPESESLHREVGNHLSQLNIDYLITMGEMGKKIAEGARSHGFSDQRILSYTCHQALLEELIKLVHDNDIIYFKASRALELEKIAIELEKSQ